MDLGLFWRALAVQALCVGVVFGVLLALPLDRELFRDYGAAIGPVSWATCSLLTARLLSLSPATALTAAFAGGAAGLLAGLALGHGPGLLISLVLFAATCAIVAGRPRFATDSEELPV